MDEGLKDGSINPEDANRMGNLAVLTQLMYAAKFGEKEDARRILENFDPYWLEDPDNDDRIIVDNIRDWMNDSGSAEKAHVQNTLPDVNAEYRPVGFEDSGSWLWR